MSISEQITALTTDKTNIANAITAKGGTVASGDGFDNFADDIATIQTAKVEQSKTLILGSATPQTVTPDTGKVLSSVPVTLDTSVIKAENIAKDVQMLGITGTHEGGSARLKDISPITTNGTYAVYSGIHTVTTLTNTNNGCFKTPFIPDVDSTSYKIDFQFTATADTLSTRTNQILFGCYATGGGCIQFSVYRSSGTGNFSISAIISKRAYSASIAINEGDVFTCSISNTEMIINGTSYSPSSYITTGTGNQMAIFTRTDGDGSIASTSFYKGTINYLKVYEGSALKYWFVPARNSDNEPLFYDSVSGGITALTSGSGITIGTDVADVGYDGFQSPLVVNVPEPTKYGATVDDFLGDVNGSGVYQTTTANNHDIVFTGLKSFASNKTLQYLFAFGRGGEAKVSMPDFVTDLSSCCAYLSYYGTVKEFSADAIETIDAGSVFTYAFSYNDKIQKISFPNLKEIKGTYNFNNFCYRGSSGTNLTEIDFDNLESIGTTTANASSTFVGGFRYNTGLGAGTVFHPFPKLNFVYASSCFLNCFYGIKCQMIVFDSLPLIGSGTSETNTMQNMCAYCNMPQRDGDYKKNGIAFPLVTQIGQTSTSSYGLLSSLFSGKTGQVAAYFDELTTINNSSTTTSRGQFALSNISYVFMPKVTYMGVKDTYTFYSASVVEFHFGIENQATIEALSGYSSKFGSSSATVYFDLANHITVDGVVYDRDGSKSDYDNWYFGWTDSNSNTVYTDNFTGAVGDITYTKSGTTYTASSTVTAVA